MHVRSWFLNAAGRKIDPRTSPISSSRFIVAQLYDDASQLLYCAMDCHAHLVIADNLKRLCGEPIKVLGGGYVSATHGKLQHSGTSVAFGSVPKATATKVQQHLEQEYPELH